MKKFKLVDCVTLENVFGGELNEDNCYLAAYPVWLGKKTHRGLDVGESTLAEFRLSGSTGTYKVIRTK